MELGKLGMNVIGIPGTIENDVWGTDYTIGSDTAANTVVDAINKLRDTACAHRRIILLEVMGKTSGWLAMETGIAGGAEYVLVPEAKYNLDRMCTEVRQAYEAGKRYSIIVVSEGAGSAVELGKQVGEKTQIDTRVTVLGHIQRGGTPTARDRVMATRMGFHAVEVLAEGRTNRLVCTVRGVLKDVDLAEGLAMKKTLSEQQYRVLEAMTGV